MAKLEVLLKGEGTIDNAVIYLEDPTEKMPYFLEPQSNEEWQKRNISVPLLGDLDYSLYVLALSKTKFECTIKDSKGKKIEFTGITGKKIRNRAHLSGSKKLK